MLIVMSDSPSPCGFNVNVTVLSNPSLKSVVDVKCNR